MKDPKESDSRPLWLQTANAALEKKKAEIAQLIPDEKKDFYYYSQEFLLKRAGVDQKEYDKSIEALKKQKADLDTLIKQYNNDRAAFFVNLVSWKVAHKNKVEASKKQKKPIAAYPEFIDEKYISVEDDKNLSLAATLTCEKELIKEADKLNECRKLLEQNLQTKSQEYKKAEEKLTKCYQAGVGLKAECEKQLKSIDDDISALVVETQCTNALLAKSYESRKQYQYDDLKQIYETSVKTKNELSVKCGLITQRCENMMTQFGCSRELTQARLTKLIGSIEQISKTLTSVLNVLKEHEKKNPKCNEKETNKKLVDEKHGSQKIIFNQVSMTNGGDESKRDISPLNSHSSISDKHALSDKYDLSNLITEIKEANSLLVQANDQLSNLDSKNHKGDLQNLRETLKKSFSLRESFKHKNNEISSEYLKENSSLPSPTSEKVQNLFRNLQKAFIEFDETLLKVNDNLIRCDKSHSEIVLDDLLNVIIRIANEATFWGKQVSPKWGSNSKIGKTEVPTGIAEIYKLMEKNKSNANKKEILEAIKKVCKSRIDSGIGFFAQRNLTTTDRFYRMIAGIDLNKIDKDSLTKKIDDLYDIPGLKYLDNREVRVFEASVCV